MKNLIKESIINSVKVKTLLLNDDNLQETIQNVVVEIVNCYRNGGKVLFCGNGGSAADAQHLSAELSGRFYYDREPLFSEALHVNSSYMTAVANDYSFDVVYSRAVKAFGVKGDILIGLSTSGNSLNIIKAFETANNLGMITVGMTGQSGGLLKEKSTYLLNMPSKDTPRIQESHIMIGHIICQLVEAKIFPK